MSDDSEMKATWAFDPEEDNITLHGAPIFMVYRQWDFPCIEDEDRAKADLEYLTHATVAVMLLNTIATTDKPTVGEALATRSNTKIVELLREAAEPWADYHGDLPDYDHPLRPVYESGIQYAVELLAKVLGVDGWEICDGTEEFDGDLGGTLLNIVAKTWPTDHHGDWIDLRDGETRTKIDAYLATHIEEEG